jgi:hypothetical protein
MTNLPIKGEHSSNSHSENQKGIENHKVAAKHHEEAAKHHHEAAKHHEAENHEKASHSTIKAQGHAIMASKAQKEDVKHHCTTS